MRKIPISVEKNHIRHIRCEQELVPSNLQVLTTNSKVSSHQKPSERNFVTIDISI